MILKFIWKCMHDDDDYDDGYHNIQSCYFVAEPCTHCTTNLSFSLSFSLVFRWFIKKYTQKRAKKKERKLKRDKMCHKISTTNAFVLCMTQFYAAIVGKKGELTTTTGSSKLPN